MDTLEKQIDRWLDDELSPSDWQHLSARLSEDAASMHLFAERVGLHADLRRTLRRRHLQRDAIAAAEASTSTRENIASNDPQPLNRRIATRRAVVAACVLLVGVTLIISWLGLNSGDSSTQQWATLSHQVNAVWEVKPVQERDSIGSEVLRLKSGLARLDFENGAFVTLQGPAVFEIYDANRTRLHSGIVTAHIPKSAVGFQIETPALDVTDLGTAFGVSVDAGGQTEVCVFEGEVAVKLPNGPSDSDSVRVVEGRSVATRKGAGDIDRTEFQSERFRESWSLTSGVLETSGKMRFVSPGPSFVPGRHEDSHHILVFPERRDVMLETPVPIDLSSPGQYRRIPRRQIVVLKPGRRVHSYLIQFDPIGRLARRDPGKSRIRGRIVFDQPIVALIAAGPKLIATDPLLGHPAADYGRLPRGIEAVRPQNPDNEGRDRVVLADDRRTLTLDLAAGSAVDQIRVLVLSSSNESELE
jgi:hypothetical protein